MKLAARSRVHLERTLESWGWKRCVQPLPLCFLLWGLRWALDQVSILNTANTLSSVGGGWEEPVCIRHIVQCLVQTKPSRELFLDFEHKSQFCSSSFFKFTNQALGAPALTWTLWSKLGRERQAGGGMWSVVRVKKTRTWWVLLQRKANCSKNTEMGSGSVSGPRD